MMDARKNTVENSNVTGKRIFSPWPYFGSDEIDKVRDVLQSGKVNYWTGEEGKKYEKEFAAFTGCKYAVSICNGSNALELALYALGIGRGDEVIVPSRTFIATASCVVIQGAKPVFADADSVSQNITAETIAAVLTPKTKAIIVVHLAGWPCEMDLILELAKKHDLKVIEDCAQAHGAEYKKRPVGSLGHVAAFSFCQDKIMTTGGEGGMLVTNDSAIWEKAWSFKDHGKNYDKVFNKKHPPGFCWLHDSFGTNWRLTEMQSAIGRIQLQKLNGWVYVRRRNAAIMSDAFSRIHALHVTTPPEYIRHSYYKYYTFVRTDRLKKGWDRDRIMAAINAEGIPCFTGICPEIYLEKAFDENGSYPPARMPAAKRLGETSLMFLVHPTLGKSVMEDSCNIVSAVMKRAAK